MFIQQVLLQGANDETLNKNSLLNAAQSTQFPQELKGGLLSTIIKVARYIFIHPFAEKGQMLN